MGDRHVPVSSGSLSPLNRQVGFDALDEPPQPLAQLRAGVLDRVCQHPGVEPGDGLGSLEGVDRRGDVAYTGEVDPAGSERRPHGRGLLTDPLRRGEPLVDLALAQAHGLADRHRDRGPFDQPPHQRLDVLGAGDLGVTVGQHRRHLTCLGACPLTHDVGQDIGAARCRGGGHTSNLEVTTDTHFRCAPGWNEAAQRTPQAYVCFSRRR